MLRFSGNAFWTALGGLQLHDTAVGIANFNGDITVRGGVWTVLIHNPSTLDVKVKMFIQRTVDTPNFAFEPATASIAWDPTASPDFIDKVGKPQRLLKCCWKVDIIGRIANGLNYRRLIKSRIWEKEEFLCVIC